LELDGLKSYLDTSPALKLLKSSNAAYVIYFLYSAFKKPGHIAVPMQELQASLSDYRETLHENYPEALADKSDSYLSTWCSGENRWLHRYLEVGRNEAMFQLTPHSEDVLLFLDRALQRDLGFVGTESRLKLVISTLSELVAETSSDPNARLKHLQEQRDRIDMEIARIARDGVAARLEPAAARERFAMAVDLLKQLLGDFRAVEDGFKEITQQVQQRQVEGQETRGAILAFALDSEDVLKKEDQGVSFYEFVRFILSPVQQERLGKLIEELVRLDELASQVDGLATVRRMIPSLLAEAEKVMRTNQRLSATLRRLLDSRAASERRRLSQLLAEIRRLALRLAPEAPQEGIGLEVETAAGVASPMNRSFWTQPTQFKQLELTEHAVDDAQRLRMFELLARMHRLDLRGMRSKISKLTAGGDSVTLRQVVDAYPPSAGIVELLGYLQIAKDDNHLISRTDNEEIVLQPSASTEHARKVTVPLVFYLATEGGNCARTPAAV
jgi:hypothetical protein